MLPSTNTSSTASLVTRVFPTGHSPESTLPAATVVYRVIHLPGGGWRLEKSGGDVGGLFNSKHAALSYACGQAEWCGSSSVVIELSEQ